MYISKVYTTLYSLGLLASSCSANPVGGTSLSYERWARSLAASDALSKRSSKPYPSKADCETNAQTPGSSKSLYFSGVGRGGPVWNGLLSYKNANGLLLVNDIYTPNPEFCAGETPQDESSSEYLAFASDFCAVFAEKSSGTAFVGIPSNCNPNPDSIWKTIEYPSLTANAQVTKIVRFDPTATDQTTIIYPVQTAAAATTLSACTADDYFYSPAPSSATASSTAASSVAAASASVTPQAAPACSTGTTVATSDAQNVQAQLAGKSGQTCVSSTLCADLGTSGTATVSLCSTNSASQCVDNSDLAVVVKDIIVDCTNNDLVAGSATIPSATGLTVKIAINDST